MIELQPIFRYRDHVQVLYDLLGERTPDQSISHGEMPDLETHAKFVRSKPYDAWYFIVDNEVLEGIVGSLYLTDRKEIGIAIFEKYKGKGYGTEAVKKIMAMWKGPFYANINPVNTPSVKFFKGLGAELVQHTYRLDLYLK